MPNIIERGREIVYNLGVKEEEIKKIKVNLDTRLDMITELVVEMTDGDGYKIDDIDTLRVFDTYTEPKVEYTKGDQPTREEMNNAFAWLLDELSKNEMLRTKLKGLITKWDKED